MNTALQSSLNRSMFTSYGAGALLVGLLLAAASADSARAQGQIASGTISGSGSGPYTYDLTFSDAQSALSPVGSVWYAWVPGAFYLPGIPSSASAPAGWTATVDNNSVQYVANSSASDLAPGTSLSGFGYQASFSPSTLASTANSGRSDAYTGGIFSSADDIFVVQIVPEPSTLSLLIPGAVGLWRVGRRKLRAA